jgi:hypothetical protein
LFNRLGDDGDEIIAALCGVGFRRIKKGISGAAAF